MYCKNELICLMRWMNIKRWLKKKKNYWLSWFDEERIGTLEEKIYAALKR
jgi:hypothetical protein